MQIVEVIREWTAGTDITVQQLIGGANSARQIEKLKKKTYNRSWNSWTFKRTSKSEQI